MNTKDLINIENNRYKTKTNNKSLYIYVVIYFIICLLTITLI
jgi:hypothetical protein